MRGEGDATEATATKAAKTTRATRTTPSRARIASLVARAVAWWFAWAARNARARTPTRAASDRRPSPPSEDTSRRRARWRFETTRERCSRAARIDTCSRGDRRRRSRIARARRRARRRRRRDVQTVSRRGGTQTRGVARGGGRGRLERGRRGRGRGGPGSGRGCRRGTRVQEGVDG